MNRWIRAAGVVVIVSVGCTTPKVVAPQELPLKRVAIYRNGVGYFERSGKVRAEHLQFHVKPQHVGDFLASLAVMEKGGSSVRAATFPLHVERDAPPPPPPPPGPRPTGPQVPEAPQKLLEPMATVVLELDGEEHALAVGYITEQPVWKPSYRIVVEKDGLTLQAWGIVQNLSGEDWNDVNLSLFAGAPIAFRATLQTPVTPVRPVVSDTGEVISAVPRSQSSLAQAPPPPPAPPSWGGPGGVAMGAPSAPAPRARPPSASKATRSRAEADEEMGAAAPAEAPPSYDMQDTAPRNMSLIASQVVEGGATRYDLPYTVTVPNDSATMVLLLARKVKGEAVYMFAPEGGVPDSARHPFRVARFTNETPGLLERGPIAVYEASSFLGQGVLEPLSAGGSATVPFALERGIAVDVDRKSTVEEARLAHIEHSQLTLERDQVLRTTYKLRNGADQEVKIVVRHPRQHGMRLHDPVPGTDDQIGAGVALVPAKVAARSTGELKVDERRGFPTVVDWMSAEADQAVRGYLSDKRADPKLALALKNAWVTRELLIKAAQEHDKLQAEQQILQDGSEQTRANLKSIQRNTTGVEELRRQLADRLIELDTKLAKVNKRLVELELAMNEQRVRFTEAIRDLKLDEPLPPA